MACIFDRRVLKTAKSATTIGIVIIVVLDVLSIEEWFGDLRMQLPLLDSVMFECRIDARMFAEMSCYDLEKLSDWSEEI